MGLLDRWAKKTEKEQLQQAASEKTDAVVKDAQVVEDKTEKSAGKKAKAVKTIKKDKPAESTAVKSAQLSFNAHRILIRPVVTEKAAVAQSLRKYSFVVNRSATKKQVKAAIVEAYGVAPSQVNLINMQGRWVRFGRNFGRRGDYKKAIITLPEGKDITIHEGV